MSLTPRSFEDIEEDFAFLLDCIDCCDGVLGPSSVGPTCDGVLGPSSVGPTCGCVVLSGRERELLRRRGEGIYCVGDILSEKFLKNQFCWLKVSTCMG